MRLHQLVGLGLVEGASGLGRRELAEVFGHAAARVAIAAQARRERGFRISRSNERRAAQAGTPVAAAALFSRQRTTNDIGIAIDQRTPSRGNS
jgi:hypothetical protein